MTNGAADTIDVAIYVLRMGGEMLLHVVARIEAFLTPRTPYTRIAMDFLVLAEGSLIAQLLLANRTLQQRLALIYFRLYKVIRLLIRCRLGI